MIYWGSIKKAIFRMLFKSNTLPTIYKLILIKHEEFKIFVRLFLGYLILHFAPFIKIIRLSADTKKGCQC